MRQVAIGALNIVIARIKQCGQASKAALDHESISYWNKELLKASALKKRIEKRFKVSHNVLFVDFTSKKRVA
jgi:hypothetical protein